MMKKQKSRKPGHKTPVFLIGWGREGAKDVAYAREEFPFDKGLDCLDAQGAINEDVFGTIKDWLKLRISLVTDTALRIGLMHSNEEENEEKDQGNVREDEGDDNQDDDRGYLV